MKKEKKILKPEIPNTQRLLQTDNKPTSAIPSHLHFKRPKKKKQNKKLSREFENIFMHKLAQTRNTKEGIESLIKVPRTASKKISYFIFIYFFIFLFRVGTKRLWVCALGLGHSAVFAQRRKCMNSRMVRLPDCPIARMVIAMAYGVSVFSHYIRVVPTLYCHWCMCQMSRMCGQVNAEVQHKAFRNLFKVAVFAVETTFHLDCMS